MYLEKLPEHFKDRFPDRGRYRDVNLVMPARQATLGCLFADGHTEPATWTGRVWWTYGGEVQPIGWRPSIEGHSINTGMGGLLSREEIEERNKQQAK
jgi:hypothetical protein